MTETSNADANGHYSGAISGSDESDGIGYNLGTVCGVGDSDACYDLAPGVYAAKGAVTCHGFSDGSVHLTGVGEVLVMGNGFGDGEHYTVSSTATWAIYCAQWRIDSSLFQGT